MKNQSLQHDTAMAVVQCVLEQLKDDMPYQVRLKIMQLMQLLYSSFKAGLKKYEEMADRRERRLHPSSN